MVPVPSSVMKAGHAINSAASKLGFDYPKGTVLGVTPEASLNKVITGVNGAVGKSIGKKVATGVGKALKPSTDTNLGLVPNAEFTSQAPLTTSHLITSSQ